MTSANSGSMQFSSSSDEFNSNTADSLSTIFQSSATAPAAAVAVLPAPGQPPPPSSSIHNHRHFFDPISYLDATTSTGIDFPSLTKPSSSSSDGIGIGVNILSTVQPPDQSVTAAAPRSSKKRSRASRRAPTTVLNTDTSNFRAMVQQFTGAPAPPFHFSTTTTSRSPFASSRFDLFRSSHAFGSSSVLQPPPCLLRPFPQEVQVSSLTTTATIITAPTIYSSSTAASNISTSIAATNSNVNSNLNASVQISTTSSTPNLGLHSQRQPLLNTQSPMLTLQTFLHAKCTTKPQIASPCTEYGSNNLGFPTAELTVPAGMHSSWDNESRPEVGDRAQLRPITGWNYSESQQGVSSCKLICLAPGSPGFNAEKGPERAP